MKITKQSVLTSQIHTREIDVTPEQIEIWEQGMLIQDAMPHLSADDREFMINGITPEEWEEYMGEEDDDDDDDDDEYDIADEITDADPRDYEEGNDLL